MKKKIAKNSILLIFVFAVVGALVVAPLLTSNALSQTDVTDATSMTDSATGASATIKARASNSATKYTDVEEDDWFAHHLQQLVDLKIIDGYPDGSFRPSKVLTKAEFIKLLISSVGVEPGIEANLVTGTGTNPSANQPANKSHWANPYIEQALSLGIIEKSDGKNPDSPISRQEMAKFIYNTLMYLGEAEINKTGEYVSFIKDYNKIPSKFQKYILNAYGKGIISGYTDGTFKASKGLTRAEACAVIVRVIYKEERQDNRQPIVALMYHHLLPEKDIRKYGWSGNDSVFSVEKFEDHMKFLQDNGYNTASLKELDGFLRQGKPLPQKTVIITFDDGYLSNIEYAYPILKKYGFRGSIFLIGKISDKSQNHFSPKGLQYIAFEDMGNYSDVFEFASHSYDLHREINGSPAPYKESLKNIEADFHMMGEELKTTYLAYPYGAYNNRFLKVMKNEGYTMGFTTVPGYINSKTNSYKIPRFGIKQNTQIQDFEKIILNLK